MDEDTGVSLTRVQARDSCQSKSAGEREPKPAAHIFRSLSRSFSQGGDSGGAENEERGMLRGGRGQGDSFA